MSWRSGSATGRWLASSTSVAVGCGRGLKRCRTVVGGRRRWFAPRACRRRRWPRGCYARLDENEYPRGIKVADAQLAAVNLSRDDFHGEWNYLIKPNT